MGRIYHNLEELIGHTPIMELEHLEKKYRLKAKIFAKLEWLNPGGSVKDRIAVKMIEEAEKAGIIRPGKSVIIEPTSGNTGIGLATIATLRGYEVVIVMPENMSEERKCLMKAHGAKLVLTEAAKGMSGAIAKAKELAEKYSDARKYEGEVEGETEAPCLAAWIPSQFENPAGPLAHYETTGPEIWNDLDGMVDVFVCAVGTGGTLSGTGRYLKERNPEIRVVAVEPRESAVLSGGMAGSHGIQGIGAGFIPAALDMGVYDEVVAIATEDAYAMSREAAAAEGCLIGMSSGAALRAAIEVAGRPEMEGKSIVVVLPDSGERYLSAGLF